jgi:succinoglycan biosynthesis protein ExoM
MNKIAICIPTYKRSLMLEKLILSIFECTNDKSLIKDVNIIIIDNDIDISAQDTTNRLRHRIIENYQLHYYNYPAKGLANVRNQLIKNALTQNPDFLVFVDDDEYVTSEWLNELVKTIINNNADAVYGPRIRVFEKKVPKSIEYWFTYKEYPDNTLLPILETGNIILRVSSLLKFNVWFDARFNITGAEDYYFGVQILKKGAKFYWASNALVYETIPDNRANLKWLIKRFYRGASTYTYVLKLEKKYFQLFKKSFISVINIFIGICSLIIIIIPIRKRYWGILKISEGIGGIGGFFNLTYQEYK